MTIADFDAEWHAKYKAKWLNTDLYIYRDGGKLFASATWVQKHYDDYATYYGMTSDEYVQRRSDFGQKGLVVTSFCAYQDGGQWKYCAIWEAPRLVAALVPYVLRRLSAEIQPVLQVRATGCTRSRLTAISTPPSGGSRKQIADGKPVCVRSNEKVPQASVFRSLSSQCVLPFPLKLSRLNFAENRTTGD